MKTKICCNCKKEKLIEEFSIKDKKNNVLESRCKICKKIYIQEYYQKNKKKILAYSKSYVRKKTPESIEKQKQYHREYYIANKEKFREYNVLYYQEKKEQVKKYSRDFYAKHGRKKKNDDV